MKRTTTLSRFVWAAAAFVLMLFAGQSARAAVKITALSGTGGTGNEGYAKLVDGDASTKMGHSCFRADGLQYAYIIMKTSEPVVPTNYFLIIANDTQQNPNRNWQDWTISAANFDSDSEAVEDADWTVVDARQGEVLTSVNKASVDFKFNKADGTTAYQYFMIKITAAANNAQDVWLQMGEFGFGTSEEFYEASPVSYAVLSGTRLDDSTESLLKLFDGNDNTKWGTGMLTTSDWGKDGKGAYVIFETTRPIAPTYYKLVTGTDNATWKHRNWKDYRIYAIADVTDASKLARDTKGWVLLDDKSVGEDVLPDKNSFAVYQTLSEPNTTKYKYFKVEVASTQAGEGDHYMQMSEMSLGDAAQFVNDHESMYQAALSAVDTEKTFKQSYKDAYLASLAGISAATDIFSANVFKLEADSLSTLIKSNITAYEDYEQMVKALKNHYDNHTCITGEGHTIVGAYLNDNVAPNDTYANGSYPYIKANLLLDTEALGEETRYVNSLIEQYATDMTDDAISCSYISLSGTETNTSEGPGNLFDHDSQTKWCTTNNSSVFIVFSASEPIAPTYYKLTTANDTQGNSGRNWKTWQIYGGNFDSEEQAVRDADGWELIDEKTNIGTDQLPAANFTDAYFMLSKPSTTKYSYFKIEIRSMMGTDNKQQMADFEFGNDANRILYRNETYADLAEYNLDVKAYKQLIENYQTTLNDLRQCVSVTEVAGYGTTLRNMQSKIDQSANLYAVYDSVYSELESNASNFEQYEKVNAFVQSYINDTEAPSTTFLRGTHNYIWENCQLNDDDIKAETVYLSGLIAASEDEETTRFIVLGGTGKWNDNETWAKLVDNNYNTKWGCNIDSDNPPYVIFRTLLPVNPYFYTLNTGGDTEKNPGRNWGTWKIYGANFDADGEATPDAEGWVLVDEKTNVGQNRLKPQNNTASYFGFSTETTVPYTYYMVVVEKAYDGSGQQMQELHFGTNEEFDVIKEDYKSEASDFVTDYVCEQRLLDKYSALLDEIDECVNMEALFRTYDDIKNLQDSIVISSSHYADYFNTVEDLKTFITENPDVKGTTLDLINSYINTNVEPSDVFPNGSYVYINEEHLLGDSLLIQETAFVDSLKKALVLEGYVAGTEITSLVSDPSLAKGGEGWSQTSYTHGTYSGMSAGEFCEDKRTFDINQTLTGMKNGYYEVRMNAAFRPSGDTLSTNYRAIVYANDAKIYASAVIDDMVSVADAVDGENCHITGSIVDKAILDEFGTDTLGYVIWGVNGSCIAFKAGRYENVVVAKVTDGNLTFGMKNEGTPDKTNGKGDWSAMGNVRVFYLGADANERVDAALDRALACQQKRAAVLAKYVADDMMTFRHTPNFSAASREAFAAAAAEAETATTTAAKEEIQSTFGTLTEAVNAEKDAYVVAADAQENVYEKWMSNTALTAEDQNKLDNDVNTMSDALLGGAYSIDEALAAKKTIYAKWPDYLQVTNAESMGYIEDEPFSYVITATNTHPYVLATGFYEKLDSTQNILKFEYKSEAELTGGKFYFGTPTISATQVLDADAMAAQSDWKTVYFFIDPALTTWSFGDTEDVVRYDFAASVAEGTAISLRHMQVITAEQMNAEGGELTYPTAIGSVDEVVAPVVKGIYNLSGQRVNRAAKGIYIINGRKVLVK